MTLSKPLLFKFFLIMFFSVSLWMYVYHMDFYFGNGLNYISADSKFYIVLSKNIEDFYHLVLLLPRNKNLFGPVLYYDFFLNGNNFLFFTVTITVFLYAVFELFKNITHGKGKYLIPLIIMLNPTFIASFSGPNKEITGVISVLFVLNYILNNKHKYLYIALLFALFTRFELILVILLFIFIKQLKARHKAYAMISIMLLMSAVVAFYTLANNNYDIHSNSDSSYGLVRTIFELNKYGFYFITFIPKLLINMFGELFKLNPFLLDGELLLIYFSQLLFFIMALFIGIKIKRVIKSPVFLFFVIYSVIYSVPAFIQHRYFLPIYPLVVFLAIYNNGKIINNKVENIKYNIFYSLIMLATIFIVSKPYIIIEKGYQGVLVVNDKDEEVFLKPGFHFFNRLSGNITELRHLHFSTIKSSNKLNKNYTISLEIYYHYGLKKLGCVLDIKNEKLQKKMVDDYVKNVLGGIIDNIPKELYSLQESKLMEIISSAVKQKEFDCIDMKYVKFLKIKQVQI